MTDGKPEGWTGRKCPRCKGTGIRSGSPRDDEACSACGGTGDEYGHLSPSVASDMELVKRLSMTALFIDALMKKHGDAIRRTLNLHPEDRSFAQIAEVICEAAQSLTTSAARIGELEREVAVECEKLTMHTAHVGAWLSAAAQELGLGKTGDALDVQTVCSALMDRAAASAALERERDALKAGLEPFAKAADEWDDQDLGGWSDDTKLIGIRADEGENTERRSHCW